MGATPSVLAVGRALPPSFVDQATLMASSASVLFVLGDLLDAAETQAGDLGVLAAMGPGFSSALGLLRW